MSDNNIQELSRVVPVGDPVLELTVEKANLARPILELPVAGEDGNLAR